METNWNFDQDDDSRWHWTHTSGETQYAESSQSFERPADCILDAVRYAVRRRRPESKPE